MSSAFHNYPDLDELLLDELFTEKINMCSEWLPTSLIQAQKDYFGAHKFIKIGESEEIQYHFEGWPEVDD